MKIYTYIKFDIDGKVVDEKSYDYEGYIEECKGDTTVQPAPVSEEETLLRKEILLQLQESRALQKEFAPFILEQSGYKRDEENNIVKMTEEEQLESMDPLERQQYDNLLLLQERQGKALAGELEISPQFEAALDRQEQEMQTDLSRRLGPQYQQSSAGILSQSNFDTNAELMREQARRGEISQLTGLTGQAALGYQNLNANTINSMNSISGIATQLIPSYQSALSPYESDRAMINQINLENAKRKSEANSAMWSGIGSIAGTVGGFGLAGIM